MKLSLAVAALGLLAVSAFAADSLQSGPRPGDRTTVFDVVDVSGPNKGKQLCYR